MLQNAAGMSRARLIQAMGETPAPRPRAGVPSPGLGVLHPRGAWCSPPQSGRSDGLLLRRPLNEPPPRAACQHPVRWSKEPAVVSNQAFSFLRLAVTPRGARHRAIAASPFAFPRAAEAGGARGAASAPPRGGSR